MKQLEIHLTKQDYAASLFSYADILLWFPLKACRYALHDFAQYSALNNYLIQLESRPHFQSAQQKDEWNETLFQHYWKITQSANPISSPTLIHPLIIK